MTILSIDAEWFGADKKQVVLRNKYGKPLKPKTVINWRNVLIGCYNVDQDQYTAFKSAEDWWNYVLSLHDNNITVLSYFLYAELQFILPALFERLNPPPSALKITESKTLTGEVKRSMVIKHAGYTVTLRELANSVYLEVITPDQKRVIFKDVYKLTNSQSLESMVERFIPEAELKKYKEYKDRRSKIDEFTQEELVEYNRMDCIFQWRALQAFDQIVRSRFGTSVLDPNVYTFGQMLVEYFNEPILNFDFLLNRLLNEPDQPRRNKKTIELILQQCLLNNNTDGSDVDLDVFRSYHDRIYRELVHGYRGGGIIHFPELKRPFITNDVYMIDFVSLYPTSALIAVNRLPRTMFDLVLYSPAEELRFNPTESNTIVQEQYRRKLDELLKDPKKEFLVKCSFTYHADSIYLASVKGQYSTNLDRRFNVFAEYTAYPKSGTSYFYKDELRQLIKMGLKVTKIHLLIYWDVYDRPALQSKIRSILEERLKTAKTDPLNYILKIALNSLYGKFAQQVSITPIRNILLAGLITSLSRYLMLRITEVLMEHGFKIHHYATDSVIVTANGKEFTQDLLTNVIDEVNTKTGLHLDKVMSVEVEPPNKCTIYRSKVYCIRRGDELLKEAHHAIHLPKSKQASFKFYNYMDSKLQSSTSAVEVRKGKRGRPSKNAYNFTARWKREGYNKVGECLEQFQNLHWSVANIREWLLTIGRVIEEEHLLIMSSDTKIDYLNNRPFNTLEECLEFTRLHKERLRRYKDRVKLNLDGVEDITSLLNE